MRKILLLITGLLLFIVARSQRSVLIKNITVIDVEKGVALKNANILVRGQVIESISFGKPRESADTVIDGSNRYCMPGLWDMHTHVWSDAAIFPLLTANGITGIRDMFDNINTIRYWRGKIADGKITGPEITAAGPIVDGPQPYWPGSVAISTPEQGRRAVDSLKNILHTDFIKVYSYLSRDSYFAIADEAKKQQIPFEGHVPQVVTVLEAAAAGQKSQEHLYGFIDAASDSADYYMQILQRKITDTTLKTSGQKKYFLFRTFNIKKLQGVLQQMKKYDTWICPTMTVSYGIAYVDDTTHLNDPRLKYLARYITSTWNPITDATLKKRTPESYRYFKKEFELKMQVIKEIDKAGIPILAGTDFPNPLCIPGFGLHEELEWLVKAGISPAHALQAATINGARFCNKQQQYGSVSKGKMADLVILDGNPLTDITNTKKIYSVIVHGKVFSRADLDKMLEGLKKMNGY